MQSSGNNEALFNFIVKEVGSEGKEGFNAKEFEGLLKKFHASKPLDEEKINKAFRTMNKEIIDKTEFANFLKKIDSDMMRVVQDRLDKQEKERKS